MMMYLSLLSVVATFPLLTVAQEETPSYGVDVSFPMQHSRCREGPLGDRNAFYEKYVEGCVDYFKEEGERCIDYEIDRIKITLEQPGSMQNYTDTGFAKIKAPEDMFRVVKQFWEANKHHAEIGEDEPTGYTYINIWEKRTELVSIYDSGKNEGAGQALIDLISDTTRDILQEWTGMELRSVSTYGIRIYREGHVLATHADRVPLVTSAIINVDQDVDEPWPLEVYGHDGKAVNVTMEPGDMVLYESHSVLHGRPFPLKGRLFANIFVHFEPTGTKLREDSVLHQLFRESERRNAARETKAYHELPSYLIPGTPEAEKWIKNRLMEERERFLKLGAENVEKQAKRLTEPHEAAQLGNLVQLARLIEEDPTLVHATDANGWLAIHEAARYGHLDCLTYLHEKGADINAVSGPGGGTPLYWALDNHPKDHPVVQYLEKNGALNYYGP